MTCAKQFWKKMYTGWVMSIERQGNQGSTIPDTMCVVPYIAFYVSVCYFTKTRSNLLWFWWLQNLAVHTNTYMLHDQLFLILSHLFFHNAIALPVLKFIFKPKGRPHKNHFSEWDAIKDKVEFWSCDWIVKQTVWTRSKKVDNLALVCTARFLNHQNDNKSGPVLVKLPVQALYTERCIWDYTNMWRKNPSPILILLHATFRITRHLKSHAVQGTCLIWCSSTLA